MEPSGPGWQGRLEIVFDTVTQSFFKNSKTIRWIFVRWNSYPSEFCSYEHRMLQDLSDECDIFRYFDHNR